MKTIRTSALAATAAFGLAISANATELTIAIVNNGHMINMQKVAEAYTAETGVSLNWVALEEGVLREQVTSDTATGGGQYDIINIGMQEAPIWGAAGWIEPLNFGSSYDMDDILPAIRAGLSHEGTMYAAPFYGESSMVMYRKDLTDAAGVTIRDSDSWANIKGAAAAMHNPDNGVYGACLRGKPGWGDNMAFITTVVNSFGGAWFAADMRPTIDTAAWEEAINFYVDLLGNYGPPGSEGNSFNEILALYNEGKCGMWIDATVAASFVTNPKDSTVADHVGFALAPDNGMGVRSNWLWAWALAVPAGTQKEAAAKAKLDELTVGATKTASGLMYFMENEGTGDKPKASDVVKVHYTGSLVDGTVFDSSVKRGTPIEFPIGVGRVIPGWDEGIALLSEGGKAKLIIPAELGYGARGAGGVIPPNATLIFDVELIEIVKKDTHGHDQNHGHDHDHQH